MQCKMTKNQGNPKSNANPMIDLIMFSLDTIIYGFDLSLCEKKKIYI